MKTPVVRVARVAGMWLPAILLILIFAPQGWNKFDDAGGWAQAFRTWGYPDWFRITVGVIELSAVVLLASGRAAAFGAILIIVVMLGAWGTHLVFDGGRHMTSEVVPLFLASVLLVVRRGQVVAALTRHRP